MEVPRLDHALNSPTSPCEEVIKNLSLEAIQLCDRDDFESFDLPENHQIAQLPLNGVPPLMMLNEEKKLEKVYTSVLHL